MAIYDEMQTESDLERGYLLVTSPSCTFSANVALAGGVYEEADISYTTGCCGERLGGNRRLRGCSDFPSD